MSQIVQYYKDKKNLTGHYSPIVEMQLVPELRWVFLYDTSQIAFKIRPRKHWINYIET